MPSSAWPTQVVWQNSLQCWIVYSPISQLAEEAINSALQNICRCPQADSETLKNLLEFCFHDLSPQNGATLVWCLTEPSAEEWENMCPNFTLQEIETRVGSDRSVAVLRHLLTYTDGAVILDAQARAIGVELKYSEASKRLIEARAGTRHTSAQRFSTILPKELYLSFRAMVRSLFSPTAWVTDLEVRFADETPTKSPEESLHQK